MTPAIDYKARWPEASAAQRDDLRAYAAQTSLEAADRQYEALRDRKARRREERARGR